MTKLKKLIDRREEVSLLLRDSASKLTRAIKTNTSSPYSKYLHGETPEEIKIIDKFWSDIRLSWENELEALDLKIDAIEALLA